MIPIPIALPLERCQPGFLHRNRLGQAWFGHQQRINPDTGILEEATLTLTTEPCDGDDLWLDGRAITISGSGAEEWPSIVELQRGINDCRRALAEHPDGVAWQAQADARLALQRAAHALAHAETMVASATAAVARELASIAADDGASQLLSAADRNPSMVGR